MKGVSFRQREKASISSAISPSENTRIPFASSNCRRCFIGSSPRPQRFLRSMAAPSGLASTTSEKFTGGSLKRRSSQSFSKKAMAPAPRAASRCAAVRRASERKLAVFGVGMSTSGPPKNCTGNFNSLAIELSVSTEGAKSASSYAVTERRSTPIAPASAVLLRPRLIRARVSRVGLNIFGRYDFSWMSTSCCLAWGGSSGKPTSPIGIAGNMIRRDQRLINPFSPTLVGRESSYLSSLFAM